MKALIFDVDGTLAETEDLHRRAFNAAFADAGLPWHWDGELNRLLLTVSGGIERMSFFQSRLPEAERVELETLHAVYQSKRSHFARILSAGKLTLRAGVGPLISAGREAGLLSAIVTAARRPSFDEVARTCLPEPAEAMFDVVITGSDVSAKKPDPEGYLTALARLDVRAEEALVFEDSPVGFAAARAAGIPVVVCPSDFGPRDADFSGALAVVPSLEPVHWARFGFPPSASAVAAVQK
ncbi:HAD-IA family hydrolase [Tropicimonas isoalkanivorans]|uniref:Haloacid dehalogenase superfamily, subfamily IA, variant 3 with third motif having DD or ED n=1 Tax=Tropicimonas isoalkanivorans TaxID=441112 RepID=A0A1I1JLG4_9RHOB|nr:HAD-IA family hydrolase [Tropicimonas isoalkanivorans]SFC49384.1 haloacid dehalogenase superfamily, subfamily IA, variant 3 with third motif having DD or ED [Tropicimonas isoalkanivorans]